jgi:hypothetical protein
MELEITPEPSAEERAAIAAALEEEAEPEPSAWPESLLPNGDFTFEP